jgi:hypothetical protein
MSSVFFRTSPSRKSHRDSRRRGPMAGVLVCSDFPWRQRTNVWRKITSPARGKATKKRHRPPPPKSSRPNYRQHAPAPSAGRRQNLNLPSRQFNLRIKCTWGNTQPTAVDF